MTYQLLAENQNIQLLKNTDKEEYIITVDSEIVYVKHGYKPFEIDQAWRKINKF